MNATKKILVVDDSSIHLFLIQNILVDKNYDVTIADHPQKAIDLITNNHYHIIILDIMMPDMDGFQFLDRKKEIELNKNTPVIVVSAKTDSWSIKNALDKGASDYITKPIENELVVRKVREILRGQVN
jgi:DNA-binding response OmpR family regulator